MNKFYLLVYLVIHNTKLRRYSQKLNQNSEVKKYRQAMHKILQDDLFTASEIYKERAILTSKIRILRRVNIQDIGNYLETKLTEVVLDIESHENSTKCSQQNDRETLIVVEHFYEQMKYDETIQLAQIVLKKLKTCNKFTTHISIRLELLVAKAMFWFRSFSEGMDQMEQLIPFAPPFAEKDLSDICFYLIPRLGHIATCYPLVYSIPRYMAKNIVYILFVIPLQHPYDNHKNFPSESWPSLKDIAKLCESELLSNFDYMQTFLVVRFLFNTFTVFIRLYIFLFVVLSVIFVFINSCLRLFMYCFFVTFCTVFRFPNQFLSPSTLTLIHYELQILEFLLPCHETYLHIYCLTLFGFNYHQRASRRGLVHTYLQMYSD